MAANAQKLIDACLDIRGTVTLPSSGFGAIWSHGFTEWVDVIGQWDSSVQGAPQKIVIQKAAPWAMNATAKNGNKLQVRRWVVGQNPRTVAQQANRARITAALAYWHNNNATARAKAAPEAKKTGRSLYHTFVKLFMNNKI